ncbi:trypsin-like peptidase domain-containing protein [Streptomyces sp. NPDC018693]|uniref:trypsin-like peptidase domain-containing protein n=1 Tax=unclassified Streptomyces TaxID=2593676 RepID=UPI0037B351F7
MAGTVPPTTEATASTAGSGPDTSLVRIRDLAGRTRGTGFVADHHGTVVTSHEAVDGLARLVLHGPGDRTCVVPADAVTALPERDLALIRTEGLGGDPLPITVRDRVDRGTYVRIAAGRWREARVLAATSATYTATDRFHLLDDALELAIGTAGRDALRLGGPASGGPVLDAATGAVVAVLGTALHSGHNDIGFAVPLRPAGPDALADLLARNAATVPAYGTDLNLAGVLELTATSVGSDGPPTAQPGLVGAAVEPVERAAPAREFAAFAASRSAAVLALVGAPGSGRTTELAALAARRGRGPEPTPTLWLRGADLGDADTSIADAAHRALARAARIVAASRPESADDLGDIGPDRVAHLATAAGRTLYLLLDGPEEMPPVLAQRLPTWTHGTATWLHETGARLIVACRPEYWEAAGAEFPEGMLYRPNVEEQPDHSVHPASVDEERLVISARPAIEDEAVQAEARVQGAAAPWWRRRGEAPGDGTGRGGGGESLPPRVHLADLTPPEAAEARTRYALPDGALTDPAARHPLTLRLLSEVRAACPHLEQQPPVDRDDVLAAYLDLMCLRIAVRLAADNGLRGTAVRRLAAKVSGQVHEAARRSLGPGRGELDRASFEAVFPWGQAPARLGGGTGWASAVLTEGLLVPAGSGFRFAHEELADWIQGMHLDLDEALRALVHRPRTPRSRHPLPVPRHRIGPVVESLLHLARQQGPAELALRLRELIAAWDAAPDTWWASRLLAETLLRVPDATPYTQELRLLADRIAAHRQRVGEAVSGGGVAYGRGSGEAMSDGGVAYGQRVGEAIPDGVVAYGRGSGETMPDGGAAHGRGSGEAMPDGGAAHGHRVAMVTPDRIAAHRPRAEDAPPHRIPAHRRSPDETSARPPHIPAAPTEPPPPSRVPPEFAPHFWTSVSLPVDSRLDVLRRLVLADPAPQDTGTPRYLDAVARLLAADPTAVQPHLTRWFDDERPLPATPHATVATAAQALLHTHRHRALDELTEVLVGCGHRRADELLAVLAEEEPSALCRAVDRWAHDERPARRVAAVAYGLRAAAHVRTDADRHLLRYAALALLARPADVTLHSGALALLVRDPETRARYLPQTLDRFAAGDPQLPASALLAALDTHPEPVLDAFRTRLRRPDADTGRTLRALADVTTPAPAGRVAALVREALDHRPETAADVAAYVDRRLEHGHAARAVLFPLVTGLLDGGPVRVRAALAAVLAVPGTPESRPLRDELRRFQLAHEREPSVLAAVLHAIAPYEGEEARALVHRTGLLLVRTPEGATLFDRGLVDLGRHVPGFAARVTGWLTGEPEEWAAVVGPSARRMIENLAGVRVPA